jgi:transposase
MPELCSYMAKELSIKERKEWAKTIYLSEPDATQKAIAARVGVSANTIGKWIEGEGWEKLRRNLLVTRQEQMQLLLQELEELNAYIKNKKEGQRFADSKEADIRRKLIADLKDLETNAGIAETVDVCRKLVEFVSKTDTEKAKELVMICDGFIKAKLQ